MAADEVKRKGSIFFSFSPTLDNEITTKLLLFSIISFLTKKAQQVVLRYVQVDLCFAQGPWVEYQSPYGNGILNREFKIPTTWTATRTSRFIPLFPSKKLTAKV